MSFQTCSCASIRRAFRSRSIRHSSHQHEDAQAWPADPNNDLLEVCEMPFRVPSEAPGQSSPEQPKAARTVIQNQPGYLQNQPGYLRDKAVSTSVAVEELHLHNQVPSALRAPGHVRAMHSAVGG